VNGGLAGLFPSGCACAARSEGPGEGMSGRSPRGEHLPRGAPRFRGGVTSITWRSAHRKVRWSRAPRIWLLSRGGVDSRREHVKGPCSRKVSRFAQSVALSRGGVGGGLGLLPGFELHSPRGGAAWARRRSRPIGSQGGVWRRHQRFDRAVAVGRKRPRLLGLRFAGTLQDLRSSAIHRSVYRGVKPRSTSGPRKRRVVAPQSAPLDIPRTHEIRVFVSTVLDGRCRSVTPWQVTTSAKAVEPSVSSLKEASPELTQRVSAETGRTGVAWCAFGEYSSTHLLQSREIISGTRHDGRHSGQHVRVSLKSSAWRRPLSHGQATLSFSSSRAWTECPSDSGQLGAALGRAGRWTRVSEDRKYPGHGSTTLPKERRRVRHPRRWKGVGERCAAGVLFRSWRLANSDADPASSLPARTGGSKGGIRRRRGCVQTATVSRLSDGWLKRPRSSA